MRTYAFSVDGLIEAMVTADNMESAVAALGTSVAVPGWMEAREGAGGDDRGEAPRPALDRSIAGAKPGLWTTNLSEAVATAAGAALRAGRY